MEVWRFPRVLRHLMYDPLMDLDRAEGSISPYWRDADHSVLHVGNDVHQEINDDKKFGVSLDVSQFHPEELNVHVEGHELTVEGKQEYKTDNGSMHRSFIRKWVLPESVNLDAVKTQLNHKGHLYVEAPKVGSHRRKRRIPIVAAPPTKKSNRGESFALHGMHQLYMRRDQFAALQRSLPKMNGVLVLHPPAGHIGTLKAIGQAVCRHLGDIVCREAHPGETDYTLDFTADGKSNIKSA